MKKPNFFIIGAPKCGTTSLAAYLSEHPNVFMCNPKEPHHYNTDHLHGLYKDRKKYMDLFKNAANEHQAIGEASVWYLYSKEAVPNILADNPDAKFIVMLRSPVEMAPSLHEQMYFSGYDDIADFEIAWNLQSSRVSGSNIPKDCIEPSFLQYQAACSIGYQVERLLRKVKREQVLFILLEDLKDNPQPTWLKVLDFLGLVDDGRSSFPAMNQAKEMRLRMVPKIANFYRKIIGRLGLRPLGLGIMTILLRLNIKTRKRRPLSGKMISELTQVFEEDIRLLSELVGRDLSDWLVNSHYDAQVVGR